MILALHAMHSHYNKDRIPHGKGSTSSPPPPPPTDASSVRYLYILQLINHIYIYIYIYTHIHIIHISIYIYIYIYISLITYNIHTYIYIYIYSLSLSACAREALGSLPQCPFLPGVASPPRRSPSDDGGTRKKGQMGSALMGSLQKAHVLTEGLFGVLPLTYDYFPQKCQGVP